MIKNKNVPLPIKASIFFFIGSIIQQSTSIITTPIFTRLLSKSDYGVTNIYNSWLAIFSVIMTFSLSSGGVYNNAMLDFKDELDEFTSSMLTLTNVSIGIYLFIYLVFKDYINKFLGLSTPLIFIMFITILLNVPFNFWMYRQRFEYKYKLPIFLNILITIFSIMLSYLFVKSMPQNKSFGRILGNSLFTWIVGFIILLNIVKKGKTGFKKKYWKYALTFNIPLIPHYLSHIILSQSDRIIIAKILNSAQAGLYGVGYSAASVINIIWSAISGSWTPWIYKKIKENEYNKIYKITNCLVIFLIVICIIFIAFAPEIIKILAAPSYYEAIWIIPPVVIGIFFTFLCNIYGNILFYYKKSKIVMSATVTCAISNIILNLIFIPKYGYIAAAYTTMVCYMLFALFHYIIIKKVINKKIYNNKFFLVSSLIFVVLSFLIMMLYDLTIIRFIIIIIVMILIIIERKKIIDLLNNIKRGENL